MITRIPFRPKLLESLRSYSGELFSADIAAGLTVGIVALPLAMALGIASNSTPAAGIFTAIIAGFLISALGGSKVQIGGPTAAFIPVVVSVITTYGVGGLILCTFIAGGILILMGLLRLGTMIKYIPFPVTAGFTAGIAVVIFSTQLKDFFGLILEKNPAEFTERLLEVFRHISSLHWPSFSLAIGSILLIRLWPAKWTRRVPPTIVAVVLGTLVAQVFDLHGVATIGSRYGNEAIPQSLPFPHLPALNLEGGDFGDRIAGFAHLVGGLIRPAFTIALLAAIESLLCAVVADGMIGDRHDSNQELIAQGAANIASAAFGGLPATGAIARTATNIRSGGKTPVAGMLHAVTLLGIVLIAAPLARYIPLAVLSAVLVNVAINMGEWHNFARLPKWPRSDTSVMLATFVLTVLFDITVAVEAGMVLAAFLFIRRIADTTKIVGIADESVYEEGPEQSTEDKKMPQGVMIYSVYGAFLFGAADKLETALQRAGQEPEVLVLKMRQVLAMDATGLQALEGLASRLRSRGKHLLLCGPHSQPLFAMDRHGFIDWLGRENVCADVDTSISRAVELMNQTAKPARIDPHSHH